MPRLIHTRKKCQHFGTHGVTELRSEMQTNGTIPKLEGGKKKKSGNFSSANYLFASTEDANSNSPYSEEIEEGRVCINALGNTRYLYAS